MAWLQNLAGRAEDLLNKIDQNAATVLNDSANKNLEDNDSHIVYVDQKIQQPVSYDSNDGALKLSPNKIQDIIQDSGKHTVNENTTVSSHEDQTHGCDDVEKSPKHGSFDSKSMSSHNSFVLTEDVQNYTETISRLEIEVRDLNKQLLNLQHLYSELRNENANLHSQIEAANFLVTSAQSEMEQYRARAQRILQEKENLISLKNQDKTMENTDQILNNYNEELKKEVEFQQNRNVALMEKVKKLSEEISHLQQQIVHTQNSSQQSAQILQNSLTAEKKERMAAEEDCRLKNQELQIKSQELAQQYNFIQTKNEEIKRLQEALRNKTEGNFDKDHEMRIKSLTDTLMLKQNTLETVTTERNALRIQLEKLETEYHNNLTQLERAQVRVINMNDTDDVKSQVPQFMRVSPLDAGVTRRVKHAYSTVDAISIRTGIFLRRYPVARVFVFCYMVLLHIWALILLFIYAPSNR